MGLMRARPPLDWLPAPELYAEGGQQLPLIPNIATSNLDGPILLVIRLTPFLWKEVSYIP